MATHFKAYWSGSDWAWAPERVRSYLYGLGFSWKLADIAVKAAIHGKYKYGREYSEDGKYYIYVLEPGHKIEVYKDLYSYGLLDELVEEFEWGAELGQTEF